MKLLLVISAFCLLPAHTSPAQTRSDRELSGLKGPVKSVRVEESVARLRDGRLVEEPRRLDRVATYDAEGNLIVEESYQPDGKLKLARRSSRDGKGVRTTTVTDGDKVLSKVVCAFDDQDRARDCSTYAADGSLTHKSVRTYSETGKLTEAATYDAAGALMNKTVFTYDAEGRQSVDAVYDAEGRLKQKQEIIGGEVVVTLYHPDGNVWRRSAAKISTFEYDSHGNWTKQTVPRTVTSQGVNEEKISVSYRVITYYPAPTAVRR